MTERTLEKILNDIINIMRNAHDLVTKSSAI
jgi:hypothetical protein